MPGSKDSAAASKFYIDGLVQERRNSSALAMELRLIYYLIYYQCTGRPYWRTDNIYRASNLSCHYYISSITWAWLVQGKVMNAKYLWTQVASDDEHAVMNQYWAKIQPMLPVMVTFSSSIGTIQHFYEGDSSMSITQIIEYMNNNQWIFSRSRK